jgi:hypothetical protein
MENTTNITNQELNNNTKDNTSADNSGLATADKIALGVGIPTAILTIVLVVLTYFLVVDVVSRVYGQFITHRQEAQPAAQLANRNKKNEEMKKRDEEVARRMEN